MIKLQFKLPQALISQVLPEGQYFMPLLFSKKGLFDLVLLEQRCPNEYRETSKKIKVPVTKSLK